MCEHQQAGGAWTPGPASCSTPPPRLARSACQPPPTPGLRSTPLPAPVPEYTLEEFKRTIWGADQVPAAIAQLYGHFTAARASPDPAPHWAAMEALIRATTYADPKTGVLQTLNGGWPPANGGFNKKLVQPTPPDKFDRYQKKVAVDEEGLPVLGGTFTSPIPPSGAFDYEGRALEGKEEEYDLIYEIEILEPLPFQGEEATVIPWHGHEGNAVQTRMLFPGWKSLTGKFPWDWFELQKQQYVRITYKSSPSGKFEILPGNRVRAKKQNHV